MNKLIKKSLLFVPILLITVIAISQSALFNLSAENLKLNLSTDIIPLSHFNGESVVMVPDEIAEWVSNKQFDAETLNSLYEFKQSHRTFGNYLNDDVKTAKIYRETDAFLPTNNVLTWKCNLKDVVSYKVRVAYDNKFTKCCLIENNADIKSGVTIENPFANTNYYWQVIATKRNGDRVYSKIFDFKTADTIRTVLVDGVSNTRDIGGYDTDFGYVKQGLVYRSARLESISAEGKETLINKLGVKTDLDLRGQSESTGTNNRQNPASLEKYYVFDTPMYATYISENWQSEEDAEKSQNSGINAKKNYAVIGEIMRVFANKDNYPIDFHCAVGRDRTGTVSMLLKSVLGYKQCDIVNDYFVSMFSTTGAWAKEYTFDNYNNVKFVFDYLNSFSGDTLADKTSNYLINKCGVTQEEIDTIRNIMTGKEGYEVSIGQDKVVCDVDNYSDCCFVTFVADGERTVSGVVANGETLTPRELDGAYWTLNGEQYDFSLPVNKDITLIAIKSKKLNVTVIITGNAEQQEEVLELSFNQSFDFSKYNNGKPFRIVDEQGKIIKSLIVTDDCVINIVYM